MSEIRRDVPLFNETLNLHTTSASQEECEVPLTLKILPGNRQHGNQLEKFLRFEVSYKVYYLRICGVGLVPMIFKNWGAQICLLHGIKYLNSAL